MAAARNEADHCSVCCVQTHSTCSVRGLHLYSTELFQCAHPFSWFERGGWLLTPHSSSPGITVLCSLTQLLVFSNQPYTEVLLNWLIAVLARTSLDLPQVLVVVLDHKLHSLLRERELNSNFLNFLPVVLREGEFLRVMMVRLANIRLLNRFGNDVINYDTVAILLRDLATLHYRNSQATIIGRFGHFPTDVQRKWGITLCTAMLVMKTSSQRGMYGYSYFILVK